MIRFTVMYPNPPGSTFDWDYYLSKHLDLSHQHLDHRGLVRREIDRGLAGFPPGAPPPYHVMAHLFFNSLQELETAMKETAAEFIADERRYASVPSVLQISEVMEVPALQPRRTAKSGAVRGQRS